MNRGLMQKREHRGKVKERGKPRGQEKRNDGVIRKDGGDKNRRCEAPRNRFYRLRRKIYRKGKGEA